MPSTRIARALLPAIEAVCGAALAADVGVVFFSVVRRYFFHDPLHWAEEAARALMLTLVFFGAALALARGKHAGIDSLRGLFPSSWRDAMAASGAWIVAAASLCLAGSAALLLKETAGQTTPFGLPQCLFVGPVLAGSALMGLVGVAQALAAPRSKAGAAIVLAGMGLAWLCMATGAPVLSRPPLWLFAGFVYGLMAGVPIAFSLAFGAMMFFMLEPTLPIAVYSQRVSAGTDHFVLLAIPFFVLAGLLMEVNGMSARVIELLVRLFGRRRGGLNLIMITAMGFFSGISGSKLADVAAVGGVLMPAVRRCGHDEDDAAGLLASTAVMAETIPPCINMIIFGFVANVSVGALFVAGVVPAVFLAVCLAALAVCAGRRADPDKAFPQKRPWPSLVGGALAGLSMILMIGKGVVSGVATSTEVSAFAVVYALAVGGLAFRELTWRNVYRLFVDSASLAGTILLIVAAASSVSFALTIEQVPQALAGLLVEFGHRWGLGWFVLLSVAMLAVFGAVLEGAPALIIFGPLLTPVAVQLGLHPVHYGIVLIIAMGLGLFSPPLGLGLYTTCAVTGTRIERVAPRMAKYLLLLLAALVLLALAPPLTLWLPARWGLL